MWTELLQRFLTFEGILAAVMQVLACDIDAELVHSVLWLQVKSANLSSSVRKNEKYTLLSSDCYNVLCKVNISLALVECVVDA